MEINVLSCYCFGTIEHVAVCAHLHSIPTIAHKILNEQSGDGVTDLLHQNEVNEKRVREGKKNEKYHIKHNENMFRKYTSCVCVSTCWLCVLQ